jgi:hypothetical protein
MLIKQMEQFGRLLAQCGQSFACENKEQTGSALSTVEAERKGEEAEQVDCWAKFH